MCHYKLECSRLLDELEFDKNNKKDAENVLREKHLLKQNRKLITETERLRDLVFQWDSQGSAKNSSIGPGHKLTEVKLPLPQLRTLISTNITRQASCIKLETNVIDMPTFSNEEFSPTSIMRGLHEVDTI